MPEFDVTTQKRISLLSLFASVTRNAPFDGDFGSYYVVADTLVKQAEKDGYFGSPALAAFKEVAAAGEALAATTPPPTSSPPSTEPSSAKKNYQLTVEPCPESASHEDGAEGFVMNRVAGSGPVKECSLRKRIKPQGVSKWMDVGACSWTDW